MIKKIELLKYRGALDFEKITIILDKVQLELDIYSSDTLVKKRIYSILVEALENVLNHGYKTYVSEQYLPQGVLSKYGDDFIFEISNAMLNSNVENFKKLLDYINSLSYDEINKSYYGKLKSRNILKEGNVGIGIIQIAKKIKGKLLYDFKTINDKISYFTLKVTI